MYVLLTQKTSSGNDTDIHWWAQGFMDTDAQEDTSSAPSTSSMSPFLNSPSWPQGRSHSQPH